MNSFNQNEFEDTKRVIRQHNAKRKRTNNDKKNITHKPKDRITQTPLKTKIHSKVNIINNRF